MTGTIVIIVSLFTSSALAGLASAATDTTELHVDFNDSTDGTNYVAGIGTLRAPDKMTLYSSGCENTQNFSFIAWNS